MTPTEFAITRLGLVPYDWQIEAMESVAMEQPTVLVAANGSGKTARVVAVLVLWFLSRYPSGQCVFTSGSWMQIEKQLWPAIRTHRRKFPDWNFMAGELRTPEGGFAFGFSTDNEGRAEGHHPKISNEIDPVMLIIDEAKSVPNGIFEAFDRCTRRFELWTSSPGAPRGQFYDAFGKTRSLYSTLRVTSAMCPHIPQETRDRDLAKYGLDHPIYRSKHLAEFTADDELMVMAPTVLTTAMENQPTHDESGERVYFCDFAAGRDENVLSERRGNVARIIDAWVERDTIQAARRFVRHFEALGATAGQVFGDADGLGTGFCDQFAEMGWHINRFHGGQAAKESDEYANLIAEVWHTGAAAIRNGTVAIPGLDPITFEQLTSRRSEWSVNGKLRIEDKEKMRSHGLKSPDRADALLGCIALGAHHSGAWTKGTATLSKPNAFAAPRVGRVII